MLPNAQSYDQLIARFRWFVPERYNLGVDICDRWAAIEPDRTALILDEEDREVSFAELRALSNRMANLLAESGVSPGERIGVLLPQRLETIVTHIAAFKLGAISIPLFTLFGEEALAHRLADSGAKAVVTDAAGYARLDALRAGLPDLAHVFDADGDLGDALAGQSDAFKPLDTSADDPALIIYTSGTTGKPKGALHAHRVLLGHLPGVEMSHDLLPQPGDVLWTPADWAWIGGLINVLMPALHHGVPVVASRQGKFSGEAAFDLLRRRGVRNAFIPPTALKMMRAVANPPKLSMRSVGSGGESLGAELLGWGREVFGVTINEFYGQTECNMIVASSALLGAQRGGVMGWPAPGHHVEIITEDGTPCPAGEEGDIAVTRPDPAMFLRYWNDPQASAAKFRGDWMLTGDRGIREDDGAPRFVGRDDDVISSSGYRIGPGEIEDCLLKHPSVAMAGVVGKRDALRGEIVAAFVCLKEAVQPSDALASELSAFVRERLSAHEYPREVHFLTEMPLTTTGKIIRRVLRDKLHTQA